MSREYETVEIELSNEDKLVSISIEAPRKYVRHVSLDDVFTSEIIDYNTVKVDDINTKND